LPGTARSSFWERLAGSKIRSLKLKKVRWWKVECWSVRQRTEDEHFGWILYLEGRSKKKIVLPKNKKKLHSNLFRTAQ
jgi:hypothetical protein